MSINPDLKRMVDNLEGAGYDCSPEGHESIRCACGYDGPPSHVIRLDEVDELESAHRMFVCPSCGDG